MNTDLATIPDVITWTSPIVGTIGALVILLTGLNNLPRLTDRMIYKLNTGIICAVALMAITPVHTDLVKTFGMPFKHIHITMLIIGIPATLLCILAWPGGQASSKNQAHANPSSGSKTAAEGGCGG
jgi:hypothetical protein